VYQAAEFGKAIHRYIEACDVGNGGDFWPIVKHVSVRIPHCKACSSGAVLVDLPGIGDSNAARDKIAKNVCIIYFDTFLYLSTSKIVFFCSMRESNY